MGITHIHNSDWPCAFCEQASKPLVTEKPKEWPCEHIHDTGHGEVLLNRPCISGSEVAMWQFCPICGTPRPKQASLVEELAAIMINTEFKCQGVDELYKHYAQVAYDFLKGRGV